MPRRSASICSRPGCPHFATYRGRCHTHAAEAEHARGTRQQRGYDATHDRLRARWQRRLDLGEHIQCTSPDCLTPGVPVDSNDWQLGHDDQRRHRGPEHPRCNTSAGGRAAHAQALPGV